MNNYEILKKAIERAWENGFDYVEAYFPHLEKNKKKLISIDYILNDYEIDDNKDFIDNTYYELIFNHNFAKAFFPNELDMDCRNKDCENECNIYKCCSDKNEIWEIHLMKMVLYKNPLQYIKKIYG